MKSSNSPVFSLYSLWILGQANLFTFVLPTVYGGAAKTGRKSNTIENNQLTQQQPTDLLILNSYYRSRDHPLNENLINFTWVEF